MKILFITPTYNEKENIGKLIPLVLDVNGNIEILVIDDNSPDGTGELVDNMAKDDPRIKILHRKGKLGIGSAYVEGFKYAIKNQYDLIFQMDADLSHDPKYIPELIRKSEKYDLVLGSRWVKGGGVIGWPFYRYLTSWGANLLTRSLLRLKPKDITTGYRCYKVEVLKKINLDEIVSTGYAFMEELIFRVQRAGFKIGEIPIIFVDRKIGKSKMGIKEIISSARAVFKLLMKQKKTRQMVKFGLIGISGTVIDFGILNILVYFHMNVYYAAAISFIIAATNNFIWNRSWTFKEIKNQKKLHVQYVQYIMITATGFLLNLFILKITLPYFGRVFSLDITRPIVLNSSKVVASLFVMIWNFLGSKKIVFKT
ncbi:MAG: glycosyltransferase family 2 protein [Patescibacteria group bacterium]|jgi:dolichol-phosphate mannosyltransferase